MFGMSLPEESVDNSLNTNRPVKVFFRKTELCRFFSNNQCDRGQECLYAHGLEELRAHPNLTKTAICKAWRSHQCPLSSEQCMYAHGREELRGHREQLRKNERIRRMQAHAKQPVHARSGVSDPGPPPQPAGKPKTSSVAGSSDNNAPSEARDLIGAMLRRGLDPKCTFSEPRMPEFDEQQGEPEPDEGEPEQRESDDKQGEPEPDEDHLIQEPKESAKPFPPQQKFSTQGSSPQDSGRSRSSAAAKADYDGSSTHVLPTRPDVACTPADFIVLPFPMQEALLSVASVQLVRQGVPAAPHEWAEYLRSITQENLTQMLLAAMPNEYED